MTIDITKITPEKLAEMNDALMVDNQYLRERVRKLGAFARRVADLPPHGEYVALIDEAKEAVK